MPLEEFILISCDPEETRVEIKLDTTVDEFCSFGALRNWILTTSHVSWDMIARNKVRAKGPQRKANLHQKVV